VAGCCVYRFRFGYDLLLPVVSAVIEVTWSCDFGHTDYGTGSPTFKPLFFPFRNCGCPVLAFFARAGAVLPIPWPVIPSGLHRTYDAHHMHFTTCSCFHRLPFVKSTRARDRLLMILEQTRQHYRFVVVGYVVMPEHIHLLLTEPEVGNPSTVMQVLKQRTARALLPRRKRSGPRQRELFGEEPRRAFWQARFYDFNVCTAKKRVEKLKYMHRNPVKRGLVESAEQRRWSSYRFYLLGEPGLVQVNVGWGRDFVSGSSGVEVCSC
jgi:putative transposase